MYQEAQLDSLSEGSTIGQLIGGKHNWTAYRREAQLDSLSEGSTIGQLIGGKHNWTAYRREAQFDFYCDYYGHCSTHSTVKTVLAGGNSPRRHQFSISNLTPTNLS